MTTMIKDLLLLADIEHISPSKFEQVELLALIYKCADQLEQIYPHSHIEITVDPEGANPSIAAVPTLLERAVYNIMDNGLKYSKDEQKIEVNLQESESSIQISVKDHGIGIPEKELDQIFTRFYRSDIARKKISGSGLGLAIVETIIQKHYGKIEVESKQHEGSTFTLIFPKALTSKGSAIE
jgi:two-component system phosphate regulon sensor histidine kinase PhoR